MAKITRNVILGNQKLVILDFPDGMRVTIEQYIQDSSDMWKGTLSGLSKQSFVEEIRDTPFGEWRFVEPKRPNCAHRNLYLIKVR